MNTSLPKIIITGGQGQLSQALFHHDLAKQFNLFFYSKSQLDITDISSLETTFKQINPDYVINTAAYTAVDKAENDKALAQSINVMGAKNLAQMCECFSIPLIHLSTDYVFEGTKNQPYSEQDDTQPLNYYGYTKLAGEEAVRSYCNKHIILRVSGIFSEYQHNFFKTMLKLAKEKQELRIVADQITSPTYAGDIAHAIFSMLAHTNKNWGIYHYCSEKPTSWYEFTLAIIKRLQPFADYLVKQVIPISSNEYKMLARRPLYSFMSSKKVREDYQIMTPNWETNLDKLISTCW